ncbi:response regulator transcription factor [Streptomyces sp. Qhu-G9]|uniref:response regulator transcription factor n=1 Tax=Streptomyces sp. Qhu-G9 TaxID=3452799 RepID=UPI0022AC5EE6|nr:response regulator transcription factor [Streptomyces aurantiacus]WAU84502.1 response regulator transcription factor [Streptomyces aurantiacus]
MLESQLKLSVVAEGKTREMPSLIKITRPELILAFFSSYKDAIQPLIQLKRIVQSPAALVITEFISEIGARHLLNLGAAGILLQESASQHLPWAVTAASRGGCALSPEISKQVIHEYTAPITESVQKRAAQEKIYTLTTREREVLELLSEGLQNQAIANALTISPGTVKDHVRSLCSKLNVGSRLHAARIAWQANELDVSA